MTSTMLPAVLHHLLSGQGHGVSATVDDWLDNWTVIDADDDRIAYGLRLALGFRPAPAPSGFTLSVEWRGDDPVVHYGRVGADPARAELPDLIATARRLLTADDPPSWPATAPTTAAKPTTARMPAPAQLSLF